MFVWAKGHNKSLPPEPDWGFWAQAEHEARFGLCLKPCACVDTLLLAVCIAADGKRNRRSVWTIETAQTKEHHTTFPVELPEICVLAGSNPGDTILDPFTGSGTTGVAALRNGRSFIGVDISKEYIDIARKRLELL